MSKYFNIKGWLLVSILLTSLAMRLCAQETYDERVKKYIEQFKAMAIAEQKTSGIPASITLGQGIIETDAGTSELMTIANNHFGIKCKREWTGETFAHTDDAPNECFRKYSCCEDSYKDHSCYLKTSPRYAALFKLPVTDYANWAKGLKRCGYATNPHYAQRLIKVIEDYDLQEYTYDAMKAEKTPAPPVTPAKPVVKKDTNRIVNNELSLWERNKRMRKDSIRIAETKVDSTIPKAAISTADVVKTEPPKKIIDTPVVVKQIPVEHKIVAHKDTIIIVPNVVAAKQDTLVKPLPTKPLIAWQDTAKPIATPTHADTGAHLHNGLKAFHGHKGDVLLPLAIKYNVRYARLLEYNDIPDAPLASDMLIYLEKKHKKGAHDTHVVKEGETLLLISQLEGMMLSQLKEYNLITYDGLPATGSILHLQDYATRRPKMLPITKPPTFKPITTPTGTKPKPEYISKAAIDSQNKAKDAPTVILTTETTVTVEMKKAEDTTKQKSDLDDLKSKLDKLVYAVDDTPTHASNNKDTTAYHPTRDSILSKYSGDFGERQAVKNKPTKEIKPTAKAGAKYYTVKKGDTGFSIAKKHKLTLKQLKQLNNTDFDDIKIGQRLRVK